MNRPDQLPHAYDRIDAWTDAWRRAGEIVLLLDFDGTLAPIVERPELAGIPDGTRHALESLLSRPGVHAAVVSGRGLADARARARLEGIAYAGNHGMEIEGPGLSQIHEEAAATRPALETIAADLRDQLGQIDGALVEDKGLTLSVHYRLVRRDEVERVRQAVLAVTEDRADLRVTSGKEVLEVRPAVEWDKGRAVRFLLGHLQPRAGAPVLYLGDDTTDEDAFAELREWGNTAEGVIVADPLPAETAARAYLRDPEEVAELFRRLGRAAG